MTLPNDSIQKAADGSGPLIATHLISGKEYQVVMEANAAGHLRGTGEYYFYSIATSVHVAAASTLWWDVFNAHATLVVRVVLIQPIVNIETAVTGVGFEWQLLRSSAVGTGGTAQTAWLADTTDTALNASITCRLKGTGGATASTSLKWFYTHSEETQAGNQLAGGTFETNIVPNVLVDTGKGIVLRQNQGLRVNQETNSSAGNTGWLIGFTVE